MTDPVVLFFAANPSPQPGDYLALDREARNIEKAIGLATAHGRIDFRPRPAATEQDLVGALLAEPRARIIHFAMHGNARGLTFSTAGGDEDTVRVAALRRFLKTSPNLDLAVFNVCNGAKLAEAVKDAVPCAIGAKDRIKDGPARAFSAGFYQALAHGRSIEGAVEMGRARAEHARAGAGGQYTLISKDDAARARRFVGPGAEVLPEPRAPGDGVDAPVGIVVIAGPSDEQACRALCMHLDAPTFFAPMSVEYGDALDIAVPEAMAQARVYVVVSSGRQDEDWHYQDGIQSAIHLVKRAGKSRDRRIIPVYLYGDADSVQTAFGLRRIRAIYGAREGGIPGIARRINAVYHRFHGSKTPAPNEAPRLAVAAPAPDLGALIRCIAELYPGRTTAQGLWLRAGGAMSAVPDVPSVLDLWTLLFGRIDQGAGVSRSMLVRSALQDYPMNPTLKAWANAS